MTILTTLAPFAAVALLALITRREGRPINPTITIYVYMVSCLACL